MNYFLFLLEKKNFSGDPKERLKTKRKEAKKFRTEKKARLILRNLPFAVTEDILNDQFSKFGEVKEVSLLKRPDGKLKGVGFIQYVKVQNAAKARHHMNNKPILSRNIQVDWAISKDKFVEKFGKKEEVKVKEEPFDLSAVKDDPDASVDVTLDSSQIKSEDEDGDQKDITTDMVEVKKEKTDEGSSDEDSDDDSDEEVKSEDEIKSEDEEFGGDDEQNEGE